MGRGKADRGRVCERVAYDAWQRSRSSRRITAGDDGVLGKPAPAVLPRSAQRTRRGSASLQRRFHTGRPAVRGLVEDRRTVSGVAW